MLYADYDEQRSFPEYIDMTFKDIVYTEEPRDKGYPITSWMNLYEAIKEGYFPDWCRIPVELEDGEDPVNHKEFSKRRLKVFCKRLFNKYGDPDKAKQIEIAFLAELDRLDSMECNSL